MVLLHTKAYEDVVIENAKDLAGLVNDMIDIISRMDDRLEHVVCLMDVANERLTAANLEPVKLEEV